MESPARADRLDDRRWHLLAGGGLALVGLLWLALAFTSLQAGEAWGYDYRAYRDAAVRLDESGSLYQAETLDGPYRPGPFGLYMYAPPLGIAVGPFVPLGQESGTSAWFVLHVVALVIACAIMPIRWPLRLAAFGVAALSFGVIRDLALGNVSVLLLLPLAVAWRWLDRPAGSIAQALAISVRPTLGVLLIWQLLRRQWRAVAWTLGAGLVLIASSLPWVGLDGYLDYLTVLRNLSDVTGVERNVDLGSPGTRPGLGIRRLDGPLAGGLRHRHRGHPPQPAPGPGGRLHGDDDGLVAPRAPPLGPLRLPARAARRVPGPARPALGTHPAAAHVAADRAPAVRGAARPRPALPGTRRGVHRTTTGLRCARRSRRQGLPRQADSV